MTMRIHVVGGGGREHAVCRALAASRHAPTLSCNPGNPGIAAEGAACVDVPVDDVDAIVAWSVAHGVDLVVIGPELALAAGLVDALAEVGIAAFGPTAAAARIESSKAWAKGVMARAGVATAVHRSFDDADAAAAFIESCGHPVVVKDDGLAAGKGVVVAETVAEAVAAARTMLEAVPTEPATPRTVLVEERLDGPELSVLAFCDGLVARAMPPARDHKRALDGDRGPNTGGMGAFSPVPGHDDPAFLAGIERDVLQPVVDELRAAGTPFVGVLYAGLMLTAAGPRVIEFNARLGDPEAQVLLPRLDSDLVDVLLACVSGDLAHVDLRWNDQHAVTVVLAGRDYPAAGSRGAPITGVGSDGPDTIAFHAGTARGPEGTLVTAGGRVLAVTGLGDDLDAARAAAHARIAAIDCPDLRHRTDIAAATLRERSHPGQCPRTAAALAVP